MDSGLLKFGSYHLPPRRRITEEDEKVIEDIFYECDEDHKGYLNRQDVKVAAVCFLGYKPTKYEVDEMFKNTDIIDGQQGMKIDHFKKIMSSKLTCVDKDDEIRQTFMVFDSQCKGFLTVTDLRRAFSQVAPHIAMHRVDSAFREIDRDGDGRISYKDFEFMMKYYLEDTGIC